MKRPVEKRMAPGFAGMDLAYSKGKDLLADARAIIEAARAGAYRAVNVALVQRNWLLGKRIAEEELKGEERAEYGRGVVKELAEKLTVEYGNGFSVPALYQFVEFFKAFPILYSLRIKSGDILSWTHYRILLQVKNAEARDWYKEEAGAGMWSVRMLQRNISSQYYERTLLSQSKGAVKAEMQRLTSPLQDRLEFVKNPAVLEFLGLAARTDFTESDLETRILDNLGHTEARRDGGAEGVSATKGTKGAKGGGRGKAHAEAQRRGGEALRAVKREKGKMGEEMCKRGEGGGRHDG